MLEFETSNGNIYAWDDEVGLFIPFSATMKAVREEISSEKSMSMENVIKILKKDFDPEEIIFCYNWLKKWEKIKPQNYSQIHQKIHPTDIKSYILRDGLSQLTLGVTEDCNFRCKFCAYSDNYEYSRNHSKKYMEFSIAKKAIDYYLSLVKESNKYNPIREPVIGFYGGEPLLHFELIKRCVEHVDNEYQHEKTYTLTTNCSLLDTEKAEWLMENDFYILVSLNGPEDEHDRLRVYKDGKGTFKDVMENLSPIIDKGYEKISSLPVFDWKSDFFKWEEFFNRKNIPSAMMISEVSHEGGSKYYERFTKEDHLNFLEHLNMAKKYYFENIDSLKKEELSIFDNLFGIPPRATLFDRISIYPQNLTMPFTGSCVPGRKIFVDVNGRYHICEKVMGDFPIGNVNEGLNFEKISNLINEYFSHMDKCPDCRVRRQCNCCFQHFMTDNGFSCSSEVCEKKEDIMKKSFVDTLEIAERYPEFVDDYNIKHQNLRKYWGE